MSRRHFPLWTLLGVVLVVALLVGGGAFSSSPPTNAQRATAIEQDVRCPSCEDLSVAVSSAPTAVTVRATVSRLVDQGLDDQQIEDYLTARYGSAIVLDPPHAGAGAQMAEKAAPNALAITRETLAPLDAKERETLVALLGKLR